MTVMRELLLSLLLTSVAFGQQGPVYAKVLSTSVTTGTSAPIRLASVNQFHQLTVLPTDITGSSCSGAGGWTGQVQLEASTDGVSWLVFGNPITAAADNSGVYTSVAGAFGYVRVDYVSGNTTYCAISVWYSGTATGYPSGTVPPPAAPVQVGGNAKLYSGQQAVTATAAALATQASKQICVKALIGNAINVYVGASGVTDSTGYELAPDEAVCLPVNNVNLVYVIASTTGASVSWAATN